MICNLTCVSVPYVFTSFSNNSKTIFKVYKFQYHTFLHHSQTTSSVCHIVTPFQYHTFLHHSQTQQMVLQKFPSFQYHTFLHHSQTEAIIVDTDASFSTIHFYIILKLVLLYKYKSRRFQYHTFLHHSQTGWEHGTKEIKFQYHTFLHHSQTSNSKMNRHHLRKTRYSNTFNRFHIDLYL